MPVQLGFVRPVSQKKEAHGGDVYKVYTVNATVLLGKFAAFCRR